MSDDQSGAPAPPAAATGPTAAPGSPGACGAVRSVVVCNVSAALGAELLQQFFGQVGPVAALRPLGPGQFLVVFERPEHAAAAALLTGTALLGQRLVVALAEPPQQPQAVAASPVSPTCLTGGTAATTFVAYGGSALAAMDACDASGHRMGSNQQKAEEVARTVYVGNISTHVSVEQLMQVFGACGGISFCRMAGDEAHPARFAFVEFEKSEGAAAALRLNGLLLVDRQIKVNHSKNPIVKPAPKPEEVRKERAQKERLLEVLGSISKKLAGEGDKKDAGEGDRKARREGAQSDHGPLTMCIVVCEWGYRTRTGWEQYGAWDIAPTCTRLGPNPYITSNWSSTPHCAAECAVALPSGAAGWGTCAATLASGAKCSVQCPQGYTANAFSCSNGTLSAQPSCSPDPCPLALPPGAAAWGTCSPSVASGSNCSFECAKGHTTVGGRCDRGAWLEAPQCAGNNCTLAALPGRASGWGSCTASAASGSNCTPACPRGFTATTGRCESEQWLPVPKCTEDPCPLVLPHGANWPGTCSWLGPVASGTNCSLECRQGYEAVEGSCQLGRWLPAPACAAKSCALELPGTAAGWGSCASAVASGSNCSFECGRGCSAARGSCLLGSWASRPSCTIRTCALNLTEYAGWWGSCASTVANGTRCSFSCHAGFAPVAGVCEWGEWTVVPACLAAVSAACHAVPVLTLAVVLLGSAVLALAS
eukprot:m51a1_g14159 putative rna recognition motif domain containing protein (708) ;mRNA; f:58171-62336